MEIINGNEVGWGYTSQMDKEYAIHAQSPVECWGDKRPTLPPTHPPKTFAWAIFLPVVPLGQAARLSQFGYALPITNLSDACSEIDYYFSYVKYVIPVLRETQCCACI